MLLSFVVVATLFLAYANGANDNFKGVATLFGTRTATYKTAILWATATTLAGSLTSVFLAHNLVKSFSGKGLVPDAIASSQEFHFAVAAGAGLTVILATRLGFPISTTHSLTGAMIGAGVVAIGTQVNLVMLQKAFILPLLLSPIIAIPLSAIFYAAFHFVHRQVGIQQESCICIGEGQPALSKLSSSTPALSTIATELEIAIDQPEVCAERYKGRFWQIKSQKLIDMGHFLSAGVVSFARGLNDTPKIVPLLLVSQTFSLQGATVGIAFFMAIGGLINARRVAETMSRKISQMNSGQGLAANLVTGMLVIAASRFGLPVSTTHVSVGSIFGVGTIAKTANAQVFWQILLSWVLTLPIAALMSAIVYIFLHH